MTTTSEIFFIDGSLADLRTLIAALPAGATHVVLDPDQDGVLQMAAVLDGYRDLTAIHLLSHGAEGQLALGHARLDRASLAGYEAALLRIGQSLSATGDLLLYGCNVAAGDAGTDFVRQLARLTGADVAASEDITGATAGGDWTLENMVGQVEAVAYAAPAYEFSLATPTSPGVVSMVWPTGIRLLDSLLGLKKWGGVTGSAATVTYSFPDADSVWSTSVYTGYGPTTDSSQEPWAAGYFGFAPDAQEGANYALAAWASVARVTFVEVADTSTAAGDIRFAYSSAVGTDVWAHAYYPSATAYGGDVWLNSDYDDTYFLSFAPGTLGSETLLHETGHALGLKHSFAGVPLNGAILDAAHDSLWFTNMSYNVAPGIPDTGENISIYPTTPMSLDIRAMQYMYGANKTYHAGNDIYSFDGGADYFQCIWDGGGVDLIRYSGDDACEIDLRAGAWSNLGNDIVYDDGFDTYSFEYNVQIYDTVVIENAQGGNGDDYLIGNTVANVLDGGSGADTLDGGAGADTMIGGAGDDLYLVSQSGDVVDETDGLGSDAGGIDTVRSTLTRSLGSHLENLTLLGTGAISGSGNELANVLIGNAAANTLDGGLGNDTLIGGAGADVAVFSGNRADYTLAKLGTTGYLRVTHNDTTAGATGVDELYQIETLRFADGAIRIGFAGSDETPVHAPTGGDENTAGIAPLTDGGYALTWASNSGTVAAQRYDASGKAVWANGFEVASGFGPDPSPALAGLPEGGLLVAWTAPLAGGGWGVYAQRYDSRDFAGPLITVAESDTTDPQENAPAVLAFADGSFVVAWETGSTDSNRNIMCRRYDALDNPDAAFEVTTDAVANAVPELARLSDGESFVVSWNHGSEVAARVYNLNAPPAPGADAVIIPAGNDGAPEVAVAALSGGGFVLSWCRPDGAGSARHDIYAQRFGASGVANGAAVRVNTVTALDQTDPAVAAFGNGGFIVVWVSGDALDDSTLDIRAQRYNASAGKVGTEFVVNATTADRQSQPAVTTFADGRFVIAWTTATSDAGNEIHSQHYAADGTPIGRLSLLGGAGNDRLDNLNNHAMLMAGGAGNDIYVIDNAADSVLENPGQGADRIDAGVTYTLAANVESLVLTGIDDIDGSGNGLANRLTGNAGNNRLDGGAGADTLLGGAGDDTYVVDLLSTGATQDVVTEGLAGGTDTVELRGTSTNTLAATRVLGTHLERLDASATGNSKLNLSGNALGNVLTGNAAGNVLNGLAGADTLIGGAGNDTYVIDHADDQIVELAVEGIDLVQVAIATASGNYTLGDDVESATAINALAFSLVGNALANLLTGNVAANTLDGGEGADTLNGGAGGDRLIGGLGDDVFVVDNTLDVTVEAIDAGTDLVRSSITRSLGDHLENLLLTGSGLINGSGNELPNLLTGNAAANRLDGAAGADTLIGGAGADTYVVDDAGDIVRETSLLSGEIDTVVSTIDFTLDSETGGRQLALVEKLLLTGSDAIDGTGNALRNTLTGNAGNNRLDGGAGIDTLIGGAGDDTYVVDLLASGALQDLLTEASGGGSDSIELRGASSNTSVFTLIVGAGLEHLDAGTTGSSKLNLTGNAAGNVLAGNDSGNVLNGLAGADTLTGGGGEDIFVFNTALNSTLNVDTLTDFSVPDDTIRLENTGTGLFNALTVTGTLAAAAFATGSAAGDASDRIVYDASTGALYYDADGSGATAQVQFAQLSAGLAMTQADFVVV